MTPLAMLTLAGLSRPWPTAAQATRLGVFERELQTLWQTTEPWVLGLYYVALGILSLYAAHRLHLLRLLRRPGIEPRRLETALPNRIGGLKTLPRVTVQLPIFNERAVATRLLRAVANLDYPRELLEIQVLDDSTDETSADLSSEVALLQQRGHQVEHLRRAERTGYKAGALARGLERAKGELIAIFDADFVPHPDFLQQLVPHFEDPSVGMVQARWDHLNREQSLLTRVQAVLLDGHFLIEHAARANANRLFNFNGTAGIWRKTAIDSAGGWQHDTLTEDLDLSYRAQLAGWRFEFVPEHGVPAELPDTLSAYRSQQRRWTRGSAQTLRKLGGPIVRSRLSFGQRGEALAHLSSNLGYPLTVVLALLLPLVVLSRHTSAEPALLWLDLGLLLCGTVSLCAFYLEATRRRGGSLLTTLILMPALLALCMGLAWHNAKAALGGLFIRGGEFERTPKSGRTGFDASMDPSSPSPQAVHRGKHTPPARATFPWAETLIAFYLGCSSMLLANQGAFLGLPFLLLFLVGFSSAAATLWRAKVRRPTLAESDPTLLARLQAEPDLDR